MGRDERVTTHVGLVARAFGADAVVLPETAGSSASTIDDVTGRFGGPFRVIRCPRPMSWLREWTGDIVHLTMYGLPIQDTMEAIAKTSRPKAIVVGGGKVPGEVFERADWNVAVTNQPHSEIAALAVFLDRLFDGGELDRQWENAQQTIVPADGRKLLEDLE